MNKIELEDLVKFSKNIKVLLVESDKKLLQAELGVFKIFFDHIDCGSSIEEAYNLFLKNKYNLIITTLELVDGNGINLITKVREISKDITIFIISGKDDREYFIDLIRLGIDGFVLKPVKIKQFIEVFQKVIEKFKYKEEVYQYKINLEQLVYEKTKDLQELNKSLEIRIKDEVLKNIKQEKLIFEQSKLASMGEMIGNIAHQWRQPLSVISTAMSGMVLQKDMDILTDDNFYSNSDIIIENTQYLSKILDEFRDFIAKNKQKLKFNIKKEIEHIYFLINATSNQNDIKLIIDIEEKIEIFGYQNDINKTILNIFNNSKDAFIEKNIKGNKYFFVNGYIDNSKFILELKDNAGGIEDEYISKVFEPYFTTKHKSQGTGLGLYISYTSIKNMGGSMYVKNASYQYENQNYKGALFIVEIPIK